MRINDIKEKALRKKGGMVYYFDIDGIYRSIPICEAEEKRFSNLVILPEHNSYINFQAIRMILKDLVTDYNLIRKAVAQLEVGDNIEKFEYYLLTSKYEKHLKPEGLDRFILGISDKDIIIGRGPENYNEKTFDYINVYVLICSEWNNREQYIKDNLKEIAKRAVKKLKESKKFKKFGVTINFLKISKVQFTKNTIIFTFELKDLD